MAAEDVARLRELYARWADGDFSGGAGLFADDVLITTFDADGDGIELHGLAAFQRWFRGFLEQWQRFRMECVEMTELGDRVLVVADQSAIGQASGAQLTMRTYAVWRFEAGRVVEFHTTRHEDTARRRAGLDVR